MGGEQTTFCRLCEVGCGLVATLDDDGAIEKLRPDHDHPVSAGFACNKGLLALEIHRDDARLGRPQRRNPDGTFSDESWDEALDDIAARLSSIVADHGGGAVASYIGNPAAFNAGAGPAIGLFTLQLGSTNVFTAAAQDCANKYAIGELLWGSAVTHLVADLDHTDHVLLFGTNPRVSKGSFLVTPDPIAVLEAIEARGGTVRFVDPRRSEPRVGETIQILPDTDVYLLAALLCEIDRSVGFDPDGAARVTDLDALRAFVGEFSPERVASVVGIDADAIVSMAREFATAPSASAHLSTGVNMGRQGALAYWLMNMLVLLTGNLDQPGGNIAVARATDPTPRSTDPGPDGFVDSAFGSYRPTIGGLPGALLADMIEAGEIRALFSVAGNPALSIGGGDRLARAMDKLDLLVTVDYYRNRTGELADHVLPAADWFEREDLNTFVQGTQLRPHIQWTAPLVEPAAERRTEQRIFAELSERMGMAPGIGADDDLLSMLYDPALQARGLSMAELRGRERGLAMLDPMPVGGFLDRATPDGIVDGDPAMLEPARAATRTQFAERAAEIAADAELDGGDNDRFRLITRRISHALNTAMANVERLKRGSGADNPLFMHPDDAERIGVADGDEVEITNDHGGIRARLAADASLRPGVVAMTHGFGHSPASGQPVARRFPGVNVNELSPIGPGSFDPVSTMSQLTGIPVRVRAAAAAPSTTAQRTTTQPRTAQPLPSR